MRQFAFAFGVSLAMLGLAGCSSSDTITRGYVVQDEALAKVKPGLSQDQVLQIMGTPSTIATVNGDVFYYISGTQKRTFAFQNASTVDQSVVAIYFNGGKKVERVANYGLKDGVVFDFISRTTPTGGEEPSFIGQILKRPGST